ncbi:OLC1v1004133C1 [Oldenlandia corymbosa var. corymbosa]|uniref:OLC1v1004133C1 n=1 Tax=Oldenlandia corymbosa var. corymbosa TaxID=529605 RepID=A0AAV1DDZ4_OLDCO|nr:OLC1v1004133C1 [Oldenlandia corymbosa var. corymbosa]
MKLEILSGQSHLPYPWMFLLICLLHVFILSADGIYAETPTNDKRNCTYSVTIETSCTKGAETSGHVSLRFGDVKSNVDILVRHLNSKHVRWVDPLEPQVLDDVPRKPFQACVVDQFQVTGPCVESQICYLYLKLSGKDDDDDWRPGFAQVQVLEEPRLSSGFFYFRRYLPRDVWYGSDLCDKEVTPFGVKHTRKVFPNKSSEIL